MLSLIDLINARFKTLTTTLRQRRKVRNFRAFRILTTLNVSKHLTSSSSACLLACFDFNCRKLTKQYPPTQNFRINNDTDTTLATRTLCGVVCGLLLHFTTRCRVGSSPIQLFESESYLFDLSSPPHCAAVELRARALSPPTILKGERWSACTANSENP